MAGRGPSEPCPRQASTHALPPTFTPQPGAAAPLTCSALMLAASACSKEGILVRAQAQSQ